MAGRHNAVGSLAGLREWQRRAGGTRVAGMILISDCDFRISDPVRFATAASIRNPDPGSV